MTLMFGCICNEPRRLSAALVPVRSALVAPGPSRGWGLGYIQSGEVLLRRQPRPHPAPIDFYAALENVASDYVIGHAGIAEDGLSGNENTAPFRFRRWLFAESGGLAEFAAIQPSLLEHVPAYLRRNVRGKTPSELVFHLVLAFLHDAGALDDRNLPLVTLRRALRDSVALVQRLAGPDAARGAGNIVITNGRSMMAVRLGPPMHIRRFKGTQPTGHDDIFRAVLVISNPATLGEGFEELPPHSALSISRDLRTEITDLDA